MSDSFEYEQKHINSFKQKLEEFVPNESRRKGRSKLSFIEESYNDIIAAQKKGATISDIAKMLKELKIDISEQVLRNYLYIIKKEKKGSKKSVKQKLIVPKEKDPLPPKTKEEPIQKEVNPEHVELQKTYPQGTFNTHRLSGFLMYVSPEVVILKIIIRPANLFGPEVSQFSWYETKNFDPDIVEKLERHLKRNQMNKITIHSAMTPHKVDF